MGLTIAHGSKAWRQVAPLWRLQKTEHSYQAQPLCAPQHQGLRLKPLRQEDIFNDRSEERLHPAQDGPEVDQEDANLHALWHLQVLEATLRRVQRNRNVPVSDGQGVGGPTLCIRLPRRSADCLQQQGGAHLTSARSFQQAARQWTRHQPEQVHVGGQLRCLSGTRH